jgi:hypothetical protein
MMNLNVYATELLISDLQKDAWGTRCRTNFEDGNWTKESIDKFYDDLLNALDNKNKEDARMAEDALLEYNARISKMMTEFNISVMDAIRWDMDAMELGKNESEHYLWRNGIAFKDMARFEAIISKIVE